MALSMRNGRDAPPGQTSRPAWQAEGVYLFMMGGCVLPDRDRRDPDLAYSLNRSGGDCPRCALVIPRWRRSSLTRAR